MKKDDLKENNQIGDLKTQKKDRFFLMLAESLKENSFNKELLSSICEKLNFSENYWMILFPEDISQVAKEFELWLDKQMLNQLELEDKPQKIREKIALALEIRLTKIINKDAALNLRSHYMHPNELLCLKANAWRTCDAIWNYAGDKSTDFNHYTKRGLLLTVYLSSWMYYYSDESKDNGNLKIYIKDSLDRIIKIAGMKNKIKIPELSDIPFLRLFS